MKRTPQKDDGPLETLLKLLPGESTGAFLVVRSRFESTPPEITSWSDLYTGDFGVYLFFVILTVLLTPFIVMIGWQEESKKFAAFLTISVLIWILNIDMYRFTEISEFAKDSAGDDWWNGLIAGAFSENFISGILVVWAMVLIPLAYGTIKKPERMPPPSDAGGE